MTMAKREPICLILGQPRRPPMQKNDMVMVKLRVDQRATSQIPREKGAFKMDQA